VSEYVCILDLGSECTVTFYLAKQYINCNIQYFFQDMKFRHLICSELHIPELRPIEITANGIELRRQKCNLGSLSSPHPGNEIGNTNVVRVELIHSDESGKGGSSKPPLGNLSDNGEFACMKIISNA